MRSCSAWYFECTDVDDLSTRIVRGFLFTMCSAYGCQHLLEEVVRRDVGRLDHSPVSRGALRTSPVSKEEAIRLRHTGLGIQDLRYQPCFLLTGLLQFPKFLLLIVEASDWPSPQPRNPEKQNLREIEIR